MLDEFKNGGTCSAAVSSRGLAVAGQSRRLPVFGQHKRRRRRNVGRGGRAGTAGSASAAAPRPAGTIPAHRVSRGRPETALLPAEAQPEGLPERDGRLVEALESFEVSGTGRSG